MAEMPGVLMAKWASSRMTVDAGRGRDAEEGPGLRRPVERGRTDERKMACWLFGLQTRTSKNKKAGINEKKKDREEFGRFAKQI
jgi:hypothetical protein